MGRTFSVTGLSAVTAPLSVTSRANASPSVTFARRSVITFGQKSVAIAHASNASAISLRSSSPIPPRGNETEAHGPTTCVTNVSSIDFA